MSPSIQEEEKQPLFSCKLHKNPQNYFKIRKSSVSPATAGETKSEKSPSRLDRESSARAPPLRKPTTPQKSCFPPRAAVQSVQSSRERSSCGARGRAAGAGVRGDAVNAAPSSRVSGADASRCVSLSRINRLGLVALLRCLPVK